MTEFLLRFKKTAVNPQLRGIAFTCVRPYFDQNVRRKKSFLILEIALKKGTN